MSFSNKQRKYLVTELSTKHYDVLVIGGGITGAGIALDASLRGMKTAVVDMQDFSAGTSSRSTKLVHGGLRYLKQFHVKMVAEVGKERAIVYENGPHVTTPEWMLLPFHQGGTFGKFSTSVGLRIYDFLAGVKKSERRVMFSANETLTKEPLVKQDGLKGGGYYVEYRTDDARLTIEVMKAAVDKGACAINYTKVEKLVYEHGTIVGAKVSDLISGESYEIRAKKVINAAGPWVDSIRELDRSKAGKVLKLSKGVHIVVNQERFPLKQAIYFDTPDGRMVFAIPRDGKTYVGTTDTFYDESIAQPRMTKSDRDYIIASINYMFPTVQISVDDIESNWAGVRPLIWEEGKNPSEISRKDEIWESKSGLITIAGGKLTGYRKMAETVVDLLAKKYNEESGEEFSSCRTKDYPISGGDVGGSTGFNMYISNQVKKGVEVGLSPEDATKLIKMYGSNVPILLEIIQKSKEEARKYQIPVFLFAQLKYAIDHEMAYSPIDFFNRRTGALLFDINTVKTYKDQVLDFMAEELDWNKEIQQKYQKELEIEVLYATVPIDDQTSEKLA
ncbi:glycerol-3-phosphate dehydrogenase/oxidase [Bacillus coreaensis]